MEALGEWDSLHSLVEEKYTLLSEDNVLKASRMAAISAFGLHNWESMEQYLSIIPEDTMDGSFYRAILNIHKEEYKKSQVNNLFETIYFYYIKIILTGVH